jgi:hypothetical protein
MKLRKIERQSDELWSVHFIKSHLYWKDWEGFCESNNSKSYWINNEPIAFIYSLNKIRYFI